MTQRNYVIAIIVIVLFVLLALVGYAIYAIQNRVSLFAKREKDLEEAGSEEE
jgi:cytochrome c-type biogenesis protein CcmE